jgi:hypothetical protein
MEFEKEIFDDIELGVNACELLAEMYRDNQ